MHLTYFIEWCKSANVSDLKVGCQNKMTKQQKVKETLGNSDFTFLNLVCELLHKFRLRLDVMTNF